MVVYLCMLFKFVAFKNVFLLSLYVYKYYCISCREMISSDNSETSIDYSNYFLWYHELPNVNLLLDTHTLWIKTQWNIANSKIAINAWFMSGVN